MNSKGLDYFALVVTIIGAINWGLIGFFKFDLIAFYLARHGFHELFMQSSVYVDYI